MRIASIPDRLIRTGAIRVDPIDEPIDPRMFTSALVVASSAGVETMATIDFRPGVTPWLIALETKITTSRSRSLVPSNHGVSRQTAPRAANPNNRIWRFGRESASIPPCRPKSSAARNPAELATEISNCEAPAAARKTMIP